MSRARPINADVPVAEPPADRKPPGPAPPSDPVRQAPPEPPRSPRPPARRRRRPIPGALKLVAALVLIAIGFIVLAVVGGSGGAKQDGNEPSAPAPVAEGGGGGGTAPSAEPLGFPSLATANTTRVGGADAAANAAAVALAVFPSSTAAQRPAAVSLVAEDDWAGGIAAAVLMAPPLRAPVLVSAGDEVPAPTASALTALDPGGSEETDGAAAFAIGAVEVPIDGKAIRLPAGDPAATAAAVARLRDRLFGAAPAHVVLASAAEPAFAMPAAAWAARSGDPLLYTEPNRLPKQTADYLRRHRGTPVYVLGPSSAVPSSVVREVAALGLEVKRVSGEDPVANAIALARYGDGGFGWNINDPGHGFVLARDEQPLDAAAAAPLSAAGTWGPLLLSDDDATLPTALRDYFLDVKPGYTDNPTRAFYNHVWVIGDEEAIDVNQQAEANELAELARIGGES